MTTAERAAVLVASLLGLLGLINGVEITTDHLNAADFAPHARFHAALGGILMIAMSLVALGMTWSTKTRRMGRGVPLFLVLASMPLAFLTALAIVPTGSPGGNYVQLAFFGLGLAIVTLLLLLRGHPDS